MFASFKHAKFQIQIQQFSAWGKFACSLPHPLWRYLALKVKMLFA